MPSNGKKSGTPQGATRTTIDVLPIVFKMFKDAGARQIRGIPSKDPNNTLLTFVIGKKSGTTSINLMECARAENPKKFLQAHVTTVLSGYHK